MSAPLARSSTTGPLEGDDPLAATSPSEAANVPIPTTAFSPQLSRPRTPEPPLLPPSPPPKDFSYLQRPEVFHPLSQLDVPPPFRLAPHQPSHSPATPLQTLISTHNYRLAAISSATTLATTSSLPPLQIFYLFYTRLACLTLLSLSSLAAQESKCLEDIHSPFYRNASTGRSILPWELRVLVIRLQGVAYGDLKRSIVGYYDLARDVRTHVAKAKGKEESMLWKERLKECGVCVGNCLIEMGELDGARRHFEGLRRGGEDGALDGRLALICLKLGDVEGARGHLGDGSQGNDVIRPLLATAEGRYEDAANEWRALRGGRYDTVATQNLAVCLLYAGKFDETSTLLTSLADNGHSFHALTFNFATIYELCTERSRAKKMELSERVANLMSAPSGAEEDQRWSGWAERGNADFKL